MTIPHEVAGIIRQKKALYGRMLDTKQWSMINQIALPQANFTFLDVGGALMKVGKDEFVFSAAKDFTAYFDSFLSSFQTLHMFGLGELTQTADDEVEAIWSMEDQLVLRHTLGLVRFRGGGFYYETWKLKDGDWFLQTLKLERTYRIDTLLMQFLLLLGTILCISPVHPKNRRNKPD